MGNWSQVKWTEAGQVAELLGWKDDLGEDARAAPDAFFAKLREAGRDQDAAYFLGQALPRYEAVVWAARVVRDLAPAAARDSDALNATLNWVADPSEGLRRAAYEAATAADTGSPARMAALAVFFSGGSMAPEGQAAVPAPRATGGKLGAAAVLMATIQSEDKKKSLAWALDQGADIAANGLKRPSR